MDRSIIVNVTLNGSQIETYVLVKPLIVIGRDPAADIFLDNPGVSRQHATIDLGPSTLLLRDLSSANGTLVNGKNTKACELKDGDVIRVGRFDLEVRVPQMVTGQRSSEPRLCPPPGATLEAR